MKFNILKQSINWRTTVHEANLVHTINELLTGNLRLLTRKILENVPQVESIYLTGSYARGEGSVLVDEGEIRFLSDYDLLIIANAHPFFLKFKTRLLHKLLFSMKLPNVEIMDGHPIAEILLMAPSQTRNSSMTVTSLFKYELKNSKLIYGEDILNRTIEDSSTQIIPMNNGLRVLFDRMFGAIIPFSPELSEFRPAERRLRHLMFESAKLALACRDILLLLTGNYLISESERQNFFENNRMKYRFLIHDISSFFDLIREAHNYRLRPSKEAEKNAYSFAIRTFKATLAILDVYLNKVYNLKFNDFSDISQSLLSINFHPIYYEFGILISRHSNKKTFSFAHIKNRPLKKILIALILLLVCMNETGIDRKILNTAYYLIFGKSEKNANCGDKKLWNILKDCVCDYYTSPFPPQLKLNDYFHNIFAEVLIRIEKPWLISNK